MSSTKSAAKPPATTLTRFPEGSLRELSYLSLPLILCALSANLMMFFDRLILASYSTEAMNAVVSAGTAASIFHFGVIAIASIAEVFVGQHNGAKRYKQLGKPVWQMIWFSLLTGVLFIPISYWAGQLLVPHHYHHDGLPYFHWLMYGGPIFSLLPAVASFYIGRGKVYLVTMITIIGNLVNLLLDFVLIFGISGVIDPMGTTGAAIATISAESLQCVILFTLFVRPQNQRRYGTGYHPIQWREMWHCLRIGLPNATGHMMEIAAWACLIHMMSSVSVTHMTILAIGQSVFLLIAFVTDGLEKGVIATAANFIGSHKKQLISKILRSAILLHGLFVLLLGVPLLLFPDLLIHGFVQQELASVDMNLLTQYAHTALFWVWLYFVVDGMVWIIAGILTAAGDTKFVMVANIVNAWLFAIVPIYIVIIRFDGSPARSWELMVSYSVINFLSLLWRYKSNAWQRKRLI